MKIPALRFPALLLAAATLAVGPPALDPCSRAGAAVAAVGTPRACCKTCRKGKACGNSCIAEWMNCHQPRGCACDG